MVSILFICLSVCLSVSLSVCPCLDFRGEYHGIKKEPVVTTVSICLSVSPSLNVPSSPLPGPPRWHADDQFGATAGADVYDHRAMSDDSEPDLGHAGTARTPTRHAVFSRAQSPPGGAIPPTSRTPDHNRPALDKQLYSRNGSKKVTRHLSPSRNISTLIYLVYLFGARFDWVKHPLRSRLGDYLSRDEMSECLTVA